MNGKPIFFVRRTEDFGILFENTDQEHKGVKKVLGS